MRLFHFSSCLLAASSILRVSLATVVLNSISASFADLPAKFDGSVTNNGICGAVYVADPLNGCSPLVPHAAASNWTQQRTKLALIIRGECSFEDKLLNAQNSGFQAVIVYDNIDNEDLVIMKVNPQDITVDAVFVSNVAGEILRKYARGREGECCLYPPSKGSAWTVLAISFFSLLLVVTFLLIAVFAPRHWTQWRGRPNRTLRVDAMLVHSLHSFTFSDSAHHIAGDTCAICLEDYRYGESLRLLPCKHAFHLSCIDSWLTKWGTTCPVCKHDIRAETMFSEVHKRESPNTDTSIEVERMSQSITSSKAEVVSVDVSQAKNLLQSGHQYLDVRTQEEFRRGHCQAPKIINIPYMFNTPQGRVKNEDFLDKVSSLLNPADDILVGCQSGARSLYATSELVAAGFKKVRNMGGGYLDWVDHSFPINKEEPFPN